MALASPRAGDQDRCTDGGHKRPAIDRNGHRPLPTRRHPLETTPHLLCPQVPGIASFFQRVPLLLVREGRAEAMAWCLPTPPPPRHGWRAPASPHDFTRTRLERSRALRISRERGNPGVVFASFLERYAGLQECRRTVTDTTTHLGNDQLRARTTGAGRSLSTVAIVTNIYYCIQAPRRRARSGAPRRTPWAPRRNLRLNPTRLRTPQG